MQRTHEHRFWSVVRPFDRHLDFVTFHISNAFVFYLLTLQQIRTLISYLTHVNTTDVVEDIISKLLSFLYKMTTVAELYNNVIQDLNLFHMVKVMALTHYLQNSLATFF